MDVPVCEFRGRVFEKQGRCFCRHPSIAGDKHSKPIKLSQCVTCPIPPRDEMIQLKTPTPKPIKVSGPGTELKKLLSSIGISDSLGCSCNNIARKMDNGGAKWTNEHMEEIVSAMQREAKKRGLPFSKIAAKLLIRTALWMTKDV